MKYIWPLILSVLLFNCKNVKQEVSEEKQTAQSIIDRSIEIAGGDFITNSIISFNFRDIHYRAIRNSKGYAVMRLKLKEDNDSIRDVISNGKFERYVNNFPMAVPDSMAVKYSASVNSVHYFSVLPFGLNDTAVNKELLEDVRVKNKNYYTIRVTFDQDGGGEDFEDIFVYWINKDTNKVDYLAYSYHEDDGKGVRFREAYNERYVKGIRFVDYNNYKPKDSTVSLQVLPQLFENNTLDLLSKIELENIDVSLN
nr:DUF6503 family protein [uncultured Psychroserpens sp.]